MRKIHDFKVNGMLVHSCYFIAGKFVFKQYKSDLYWVTISGLSASTLKEMEEKLFFYSRSKELFGTDF